MDQPTETPATDGECTTAPCPQSTGETPESPAGLDALPPLRPSSDGPPGAAIVAVGIGMVLLAGAVLTASRRRQSRVR